MTNVVEDEPCPQCDGIYVVQWIDGDEESDRWRCKLCGHEWVIPVAVPVLVAGMSWAGHDGDAPVGPDSARWSPTAAVSGPAFGRGRSPRMTYTAWHVSQTTELGANADSWYRRCTTRGCRIWASPYVDVMDAKRNSMDHQHHAHNLPASKVIA